MRGRKNSRYSEWRSRKRASLRVLLLAAAPMMIVPAMADSPVVTGQFLLPPLPLAGQPLPKSSGPTINPFCQPAPASNPSARTNSAVASTLGAARPVTNPSFQLPLAAVQLASGGAQPDAADDAQETTVRLMPIDAQPEKKPVVSGMVQANPLVISEPSDEPVPTFAMPVVRHPLAAEPLSASAQTTPVVSASGNVDRSAAQNETRDESADKISHPPVAKEGPVSFSLDDETLVDTSAAAGQVEKKPSIAALVDKDANPGQAPTAAAAPQVRSPRAKPAPVQPLTKGSIRFGTAASEPRDVDKTSSINKGNAAARTLLVPLPSADHSAPVVVLREHDTHREKSRKPESDKRIVKGARPRVDVGVPPVAIERVTAGQAVPSAAIAHVSPIEPAKPEVDPAFQSDPAATLEIKRAEVRSLELDHQIRQVRVLDSSICAAIAAGPSQIQLIGTGNGVTRLAVWTTSAEGIETKDVYEIHVGTPSHSDANAPANIAGTLTRSARAAFPAATVQVRYDAGQMIVDGTCPSEESAKQVLRMIRSACLMPVVDRLSVR